MNIKLERWNVWWLTGKVESSLVGKEREFLKIIEKYIEKRQIIGIMGLRRVGKTTLLYQIVKMLLAKGINPYDILYFTFDEVVEGDVDCVIEEYIRTIRKGEVKGRIFILFDEIQKVPDWQNKLKIYYDLHPDWKFIIAGSSGLKIAKKGHESLAGRIFFFTLNPLSFREYLRFREIDIDIKRLEIYHDTLEPVFFHYLKTGGIIEMIEEDDNEVLRKYFEESIFERVLYRDIVAGFNLREPVILRKLLNMISFSPGMLLDYKDLADELQRDRRTIESYMHYLNESFLIFTLYNYSRNQLTSSRKKKKFYPSLPSFPCAINPEVMRNPGKLVETLIARNAKFFYRDPYKREVDCIFTNGKVIPVEVKYRDRIKAKDLSGLFAFMKKFKISEGMVITKKSRFEIKEGKMKVMGIPLFEYLLNPTQNSLIIP